MADLKLKFKMPDEETLAEYISIKGEKGDPGDPTKTSQLENDSDFTTNAALNSGLATKADATTVQSLTTQVDANTDAIEEILSTQIELNGSGLNTPLYYKIATFPYKNDSGNRSSLGIHGRIGRYQAEDIASLDIVLGNRGAYYAFGDYYSRYAYVLADLVDIVVYEDEDTSATAYLKCTDWYAVALDLRFAGCTNEYDGTYSTTEPSGTLVWALSDDTRVQKNINGVIYADIDGDASTVGGHAVNTDVPFGAAFTDTVYDDSEIREELDLKAYSTDVADTYVTKQEVQSLVSASPTPVSSTSEMTDTTKIYVNTTDGYWYYYNGTEWAQGGIYQAAEDSDLVNGLIYNQVNENLKYLITPAAGNINNNTGAVAGTANQLVTSEIQRYSYDLYIPYDSFSNINVYYYDDNGVFLRVATSVANPNKGYRIPANSNFRLKVDYHTVPSGGRPTITGDIEDTELFQNFSIMPYAVHKQIQLAKLRAEGYQQDPSNLKYQLDLVIGDINAQGLWLDASAYRRLATVDILHYGFDVVLPKTDDFIVYLWTYTAQDGSGASGQGWKYLTTDEFTITAGTYFRLLIAKTTGYNEPLHDIYDNDIFKAFALYKKTESAEPVIPDIIQYNPNMRSVAHQGYSVIDSEFYGNCRLSSYVGAKEHGFDYGECDIKFSSDGVPVCSHDTTFTDSTTGESVNITEHTWTELQAYNYHHERLASFEQVLSKCKELGLGLYIDHLSGGWTDAQWNSLFVIVNKYQMQDNVYWLQGIARSVSNRILSWYSRAKIVLVIGTDDLTSVITEANAIKTDLNEVSIDFNYAQITVAQMQSYAAQLKTGVQFEIWTCDNATDYKSYLPYARGITSNKICYNDVYEDLLS